MIANLIYYQVMLPSSLRTSAIIHSTISTTRNKPCSKSNLHNSLLFVLPSVNGVSTWTLASCICPCPTMPVQTSTLIGWSACMTGKLHTSSSSMRHPGMLGSSSHDLKTLLLIVSIFLTLHGHPDGGCIQTNQGGELASSVAFQDLLLRDFRYTLEPTGTDSPSQKWSG